MATDSLLGTVKIIGLPEKECFKSWAEFVKSLPEHLAVQIPTGFGAVIVSATQPDESQRDFLWVRRDNSGNFLGLYSFSGGSWKSIFLVPSSQTQIVWLFGSSATPPDGFTVIVPGDSVISSTVVNILIGQYVPPGVGPYSYYAARYSG